MIHYRTIKMDYIKYLYIYFAFDFFVSLISSFILQLFNNYCTFLKAEHEFQDIKDEYFHCHCGQLSSWMVMGVGLLSLSPGFEPRMTGWVSSMLTIDLIPHQYMSLIQFYEDLCIQFIYKKRLFISLCSSLILFFLSLNTNMKIFINLS